MSVFCQNRIDPIKSKDNKRLELCHADDSSIVLVINNVIQGFVLMFKTISIQNINKLKCNNTPLTNFIYLCFRKSEHFLIS